MLVKGRGSHHYHPDNHREQPYRVVKIMRDFGRTGNMEAHRRIAVEESVIGAAYLIASWYIYYFVSIWGLRDHLVDGGFLWYTQGIGIHIEIWVLGIGFGCLFALVNVLSEVPSFRQRPFGQIILFKTGLYLAGLLVLVVLVNALFIIFVFSREEMLSLWGLISPRLFLALAAWLSLSLLSLTFLLEVRRKIGPGNLLALVTGKYHRPREEAHVFLFLDLRGSTTIAEQLGHTRYSQFIRHCFHDLTDSVIRFQAQVYQFVGDEVVLTWPGKNPAAERLSLGLFFAFRDRLEERQKWYQTTYGVSPEFRGGIDEGLVTASEVGDIKREIAFHGDALNTAARLLELCRDYDSPVLVSGRIQEAVAREREWLTEFQGDLTLRGKTESVAVYGVAERMNSLGPR
jgi:adenylate cyclase